MFEPLYLVTSHPCSDAQSPPSYFVVEIVVQVCLNALSLSLTIFAPRSFQLALLRKESLCCAEAVCVSDAMGMFREDGDGELRDGKSSE